MKRHVAGLVAVAMILALAQGCALVVVGAAGAGAYTYISGELVRDYPVGMDKALAAARAGARQTGLMITTQSNDGVTWTIRARRPDDTPVTLRLKKLGPQVTQIGVRVGTVGYWDRDVAQVIQEHIAKNM